MFFILATIAQNIDFCHDNVIRYFDRLRIYEVILYPILMHVTIF